VRWHEASRRLAYAADRCVVFDASRRAEGEAQLILKARGAVRAVAVHPARPLVAVADDSGVDLHALDGQRGEAGRTLGAGLFSKVFDVSFLHDYVIAVGAAPEKHAIVAVFALRSGELVAEARAAVVRRGQLRAVGCAPSSDRFATVGDGHVSFWSFAKGQPLEAEAGRLGGKVKHEASHACVAYVSNDVALTGGDTGAVFIWRGGVCLASFEAHKGPVRTISHAGTETKLAIFTGGDDGAIRRWTGLRLVKDGEWQISRTAAICGVVAVGADLVCGTGSNALVSVPTAPPTARTKTPAHKRIGGAHAAPMRAVAADPGNAAVFATTGDDARVVTWDAIRLCRVASAPLAAAGTALAYDDAGAQLACGCADGSVFVLDACTLEVTSKATGREPAVTAVRFYGGTSKDDGRLAVARRSGDVHLYAGGMHRPPRLLKGHQRPVRSLDFAPRHQTLRSTDDGGDAFFWAVNADRGRPLQRADVDAIDGAEWQTSTAGATAVARAWRSSDVFAVSRPGGAVELRTRPDECDGGGGAVHSTDVVSLAFLADDFHLVSVSAHAIVLWAVDANLSPPAAVKNRRSNPYLDDYDSDATDSDGPPQTPGSATPGAAWPF